MAVLDALFDPFSPVFMQRALVEVLLLAIPGGLLGSWVVLRGLAFFTHAVGTATLPGLVVAGPWGLPAPLLALVSGGGFAAGVGRAGGRRGAHSDTTTALLLVGALALGVLLSSDVYDSSASVDRLLFGTVVGLSDSDLVFSAFVAAGAVALAMGAGRAWRFATFDEAGARAAGLHTARADALLLAALALAVVAALPAVGALLAGALLVIPAATARLLSPGLISLQVCATALAATEGIAGLWLAYQLDVPPGPAIALLAGTVFAIVAVLRAVAR